MGRGNNSLKPNPNASGDHSTLKRSQDGSTTNYRTYLESDKNPNGYQEVKGYDGVGKSHGGVSTPHIHENGNTRKPTGGETPGCFITSACIEALNLPDDCNELQSLRHFRDTFMKPTLEGKAMIDEYYKVAPSITKAIDSLPNSQAIWDDIYKGLVITSINLIESNRKTEAMNHYKQYVNNLALQYGLL